MLAISLLLSVSALLAQAGHPFTDKYADVRAELRQLAKTYPANASVVSIGVSDSGLPIEALKIGKGEVKDLIVGTHHGNEYGSTEVARAVAASLAQAPIPGLTVYVIPVLNISGYDARDRFEKSGVARFDSNRDYPGPCGSETQFKLKSTAALAQFVAKEGIVATATLHTKSPVVVWPWGFDTPDLETPHTDQFRLLAQAATVESKYPIGNSTAMIYPASGCYEDHVFWKYGVWALLFELGSTHTPNEAELAELARVNVPGIRRLLEQAPRVRADKHEFTGRCGTGSKSLDLHQE